MEENGVFYHEHGSWEERMRIEIAKLKTKMRWLLWGGVTLGILSVVANLWFLLFVVLMTIPIGEGLLYLKLLYNRQLLKAKRGERYV